MQTLALHIDQLEGELHHGAASKRLIIVCHGYKDSHSNPSLGAIVQLLNKFGHDTFAFTFSPTKGSIDVEHQVADIDNIIRYFKRTGYSEFILLAGSFGALSATIATIRNKLVRGLITLGGFFGDSELGEPFARTYRLAKILSHVHPRYHRIFRYFRRELIPEHISVPTLVIHSRTDATVSIKQSERFFARLQSPKRFLTLTNADHGVTTNKDRKQVAAAIDIWTRKLTPITK